MRNSRVAEENQIHRSDLSELKELLDQSIRMDTLVVCFEYKFNWINCFEAQYQGLEEFSVGCCTLGLGQQFIVYASVSNSSSQ